MKLITSEPILLLSSGTRRGSINFPGRHLLRAFLGGFPQCQFRALVRDLKRPQEVHEVPSVVGLDDVGKGGHRCAVQTSHENLVQVLIGRSALKARASSEIIGADRLVVVVSEGRCRRAIAEAFLAVALPAFQLLEEFLSMLDAFRGELRLRWNIDRIRRLVILPPNGERLDEGDQIGAILGGQGDPRRHV